MNKKELRERALQFLIDSAPPPKEEDEFTIEDACAITGLSQRATHFRLSALVKDGTLETRMAYVPEKSRTMRVWRLEEKGVQL